MLRLVSVLRLGILRVINLLMVIPIVQLLRSWVLDGLRGKEVPIDLELAILCLLVVDLHFLCVVGLHDESIQVGEHVILTTDVLLDDKVLALVIEDDVHLLGALAHRCQART